MSRIELLRNEIQLLRKRRYRVGLNLFNKKPEVGMNYLLEQDFLDDSPQSIAQFLINTDCLSKLKITEYLGKDTFLRNGILEHFINEVGITDKPVDVALRRLQSHLRLKGESRHLEHIIRVFSQRYVVCNPEIGLKVYGGAETVETIANSMIWLNIDLHGKNLPASHRPMTVEAFVNGLQGVSKVTGLNAQMLMKIYHTVLLHELVPFSDHVSDVMLAERTILGKKPLLAEPDRRLISFHHFFEVDDVQKKQKPTLHHRRFFLFNDLLVVTKLLKRGRYTDSYTFRQSYRLVGIQVQLFSNCYHEFGLRLTRGADVLMTLNGRSEPERAKFVEQLKECIAETEETERVEAKLQNNRDIHANNNNCQHQVTESTLIVEVLDQDQDQD